MPELTITEVEVAKEMPTWQGKGATVYRLTVDGDRRKPEKFVPSDQDPPKVGDTIPGIEDSDYGPKVAAGNQQRRGGRSPGETKAIQRQHSQHMALLRERNLGAKWTEDELRSVINWFDEDIARKDTAIKWDGMTSDVPGDLDDTPFETKA